MYFRATVACPASNYAWVWGIRKGENISHSLGHGARTMQEIVGARQHLYVEEHIVRLKCNADSVLGTTAYVITRSGIDAVLRAHP